MAGVPYTGSQLELTEFSGSKWSQPIVLTVLWQADYPRLAPDGKTAVFLHTNASSGGLASISTVDDPPSYVYTSVNALIPAAGGALFSAADETTTTFGNGSFEENSQATHTLVPGESLPGMGYPAGIGRGFDLSAVNASNDMPIQADHAHPFSISVHYGSQSRAAIESTLQLYAWHPETCGWAPVVDSVVDMVNKTVSTSQADHLTTYAVMGDSFSVFLPLLTK
jgi:hypothetical protein